jgi:hypothetical protein
MNSRPGVTATTDMADQSSLTLARFLKVLLPAIL